jgi:hypothetical protein
MGCVRCEDVDAENRPFTIGCQPELLEALTRSAWVFFRLDFASHAGLLMVEDDGDGKFFEARCSAISMRD